VWYTNVIIRQVYARNVQGDARALVVGQGWRNIAGTPDAVTNILIVLSAAAANNRPCNVYIGANGLILSAQQPF